METKRKSKIKKKSKRIEDFSIQYPDSAGIDIGDTEMAVAVSADKCELNVRTYPTFTRYLNEIVAFLKEYGVTHVAMEATGVYWINLYVLLQKEGFTVILANPKHIKNITGRKKDEDDAMWIQRLQTYGLIKGSFQPDWPTRELRELMRHRERLIRDRVKCTLRTLKALELMNIKVQTVISDIDGKTGRDIVKAILGGERDAKKLAALADTRIKATQEELILSLEGNWNDQQLFIMKQQNDFYDFCTKQVNELDLKIEEQLKVLIASKNEGELPPINLKCERKQANPKNKLPFNATAYLNTLLGTNLTAIPTINEVTALTFISETGPDMTKWESSKNFKAWLNVVPLTKESGGKILSAKIQKKNNRAGRALLMGAGAARHIQGPEGDFYRRHQFKGGPKKARYATAENNATAIYHMILRQQPYMPAKLIENQEKQRQRQIQKLEKTLAKLKAAA